MQQLRVTSLGKHLLSSLALRECFQPTTISSLERASEVLSQIDKRFLGQLWDLSIMVSLRKADPQRLVSTNRVLKTMASSAKCTQPRTTEADRATD